MANLNINISWATLWRILLFALLVTVLFLSWNIFLGLLLAIVISSGLEIMVTALERRGIPRTLGVILVFLVAVLLVAIVVYFVLPLVIADINSLLASPGDSPLGEALADFFDTDAGVTFSDYLAQLRSRFFAGEVTPFGALSQVLGGVGLAAAVIVSSFYLSLTRDGIERFIRAVFPREAEEKALRIYARSRRKIGRWFQSQILLSVIMGLATWLALALLGVPHAFVLGLLAGILEIVPFVGPILSGAAAIIVAFAVSPVVALSTLLVFLILQQLESHVLVPLIMRRAVDLHPVIVITALLIGIEVGGFLGALLAIPVAAVIQEIIEDRPPAPRQGTLSQN